MNKTMLNKFLTNENVNLKEAYIDVPIMKEALSNRKIDYKLFCMLLIYFYNEKEDVGHPILFDYHLCYDENYILSLLGVTKQTYDNKMENLCLNNLDLLNPFMTDFSLRRDDEIILAYEVPCLESNYDNISAYVNVDLLKYLVLNFNSLEIKLYLYLLDCGDKPYYLVNPRMRTLIDYNSICEKLGYSIKSKQTIVNAIKTLEKHNLFQIVKYKEENKQLKDNKFISKNKFYYVCYFPKNVLHRYYN